MLVTNQIGNLRTRRYKCKCHRCLIFFGSKDVKPNRSGSPGPMIRDAKTLSFLYIYYFSPN